MTESRQVRRHRIRRETGRLPIVGFDHMPNGRLDVLMAKAFVEELDRLQDLKIEQYVAIHYAQQAALRVLPHLPIARRHRAPRPSKSDCPIYRKQAVAA